MTTLNNIPVSDVTNQMILSGIPKTARVRVSFETVQEAISSRKPQEESSEEQEEYLAMAKSSPTYGELEREEDLYSEKDGSPL